MCVLAKESDRELGDANLVLYFSNVSTFMYNALTLTHTEGFSALQTDLLLFSTYHFVRYFESTYY